MKIRTGFVSNSSSSSFCAVLYRGPLSLKIWEALGLPEDANWEHYSKFKEWDYDRYKIDDDLLLFVSEWRGSDAIGMEVGKLLNEGKMTVPECKQLLQKMIKEKYDIDVDTKHIYWDYGEWGNG